MEPYEVLARNTDTASDNKIHDDEVARRYGFAGGLVPGVVVHAYLTHPPAAEWGAAWVAGGAIHARFAKPVYDGRRVEIDPEGAQLVARCDGIETAIATVVPPGARAAEPIDPGRWPHRPLPAPGDRPAATAEAFPDGAVLGALDAHFRLDRAGAYLDAIGETLPLYLEEGIAHPGWLIAQANYVLAANVVLGPWIHVESDVTHLGLVHHDDRISTRAVVAGCFERRGHRFVELDVLILNQAEHPVLRARHVAIYQPRMG
jgi:acyl dehydratase